MDEAVSVSTAGTAVGSSYKPVYINSSGVATQCTVTDNSTATAISTTASVPTTRTIYYGLPTINGSHSYTSSTSIYAPTSVGTSGYILQSGGSGAPSWVNPSTLTVSCASTLGTSTVGSGTKPIYLSSGTATASSSTVGADAKPIYMSSGTLTAQSGTVGGTTTPIYQSSGTLTAGLSYGSCIGYFGTSGEGYGTFTASTAGTTTEVTINTGEMLVVYGNSQTVLLFFSSTSNFVAFGNSAYSTAGYRGTSWSTNGTLRFSLSSGTLTITSIGSFTGYWYAIQRRSSRT